MEKAKKQTPIDLYLMVPHSTSEGGEVTKICLLSCKKIKAFEGVVPTKEILETHLQAERVKIQIAKEQSGKDNTYLPQPLYLEVNSDIFAAIIKETREKDSKLGDPSILALTLGNFMPCCVIMESKVVTKDDL